MYQFKSKFVFALWSQTDEIREVLFKSYKNSIDHISSNIGITDTYCVQKKDLNLSQDSAKKIRFELRCLREIEIGNEWELKQIL